MGILLTSIIRSVDPALLASFEVEWCEWCCSKRLAHAPQSTIAVNNKATACGALHTMAVAHPPPLTALTALCTFIGFTARLLPPSALMLERGAWTREGLYGAQDAEPCVSGP